MANSKVITDTKEEIDLEEHIKEVLEGNVETKGDEKQKEVELNIPKSNIISDRNTSFRKESKNTVAVYPYTDENGEVLYEVLKRKGRGQPFLIRSKNEGGEIEYTLQEHTRLVPYNLPEVIQAIHDNRIIWITEGESKVEALKDLKLVGTTCAFKAPEKWNDDYSTFLKGAESIIIIQDNDLDGQRFAENTAESILEVMEDAEVAILNLSDIFSSLKEGGDIKDLIEIAGKEKVKIILESYASDFKASI